MTTVLESQFVNNVYDLLSLQEDKYSIDFIKDLRDVDRLGISLPKIEYPKDFQYSDGTTQGVDKINVVLKSIKAPYKFQETLQCSLDNTIYQLKEELINSNADFHSFEPKNFKFLIKGKVLNDSVFVKDISKEDITITVFVTAPVVENVLESVLDSVLEPVLEPVLDVPLTLNDEIWLGFKDVLLTQFNEEDSIKILSKLKQYV